jgi:hypothetical protein
MFMEMKRTGPIVCSALQSDLFVRLCVLFSFLQVNGSTPLHVCATYGNPECAEILLQNGASVNARCLFSSFVPLHEASYNGNILVVRKLIEYGANVNIASEVSTLPFASHIPHLSYHLNLMPEVLHPERKRQNAHPHYAQTFAYHLSCVCYLFIPPSPIFPLPLSPS